jgi:glycosyltransferase involved in cell wall biosynthesis
MGSRDTLVDNTTGFLVPLNDCVALADRLQQLLSHEELRRSLGQQARSYACEQFDERIVTDRIIRVYDELLGQAGPTVRA